MKKLFTIFILLVAVFFAGFFFAGGSTAMGPQTLASVKNFINTRANESKTESKPSQSEDGGSFQHIKRFIFLPDAVNERVPAKHFVPISALPNRLVEAIVAVEDERFYSHHGFDLEAIGRATLVNLQYGEVTEGASTITQQLVKNLFLSPEQTLSRKAEELMLSLDFEARYSKNEILSLYLNTIYFGSGYYGIYNASQGYFGKEPSELSLPEAAMLAGLPNAPSLYSPYEDFLMAKKRQFIVLDAMVKNGYIDEKTAESAKIAPIYLAH